MILSVALAGAVAFLFTDVASGWWPVLPLALTALAWMVAQGSLNGSVAGVTEWRDRDLDDVQRVVRDRAYRRAYPVAYVGVSLLCFLMIFAWHDEAWLSLPLVIAIGAVLWIAVVSAPVHVLAWTLADEDDDNQLRLIA